jgi:hypothetical protein
MGRKVHIAGLVLVGLAALIAIVVTAGFNWIRDLLGSPGLMGAALVAVAPAGRFLRASLAFAWTWALLFSPVVALALSMVGFPLANLWMQASIAGGSVAFAGAALAAGLRFLQARAAP